MVFAEDQESSGGGGGDAEDKPEECVMVKNERIKAEEVKTEEEKQEVEEEMDSGDNVKTPEMKEASVIKYSVKTTPYLQRWGCILLITVLNFIFLFFNFSSTSSCI